MRALVLSTLCLGAATAAAQQPARHTLRGADVAIYNLAGRIDVVGGSGSDVVVDVTTAGGDADQLRVESGAVNGRATLRVLYPGDEVRYPRGPGRSSTSLRVRDDGTFGGDARGSGRRVRVSTSGGGLEAWADLKITVPAGKTVAVRLAVGTVMVTNVDGDLSVDVHSADIGAEQTRGTLSLDTGSGHIALRDAAGAVTLDTGSGSVDATNVRGPRLFIDTGSGDVSVAQADVTDLSIDTGSGDVNARDVRSRSVKIDTGSGSVSLGLAADVESVEVDTGSGDVTLTLPEALGAELEIQTSSGDIDLGFPLEVRRIERNELHGRTGDGRGRIVVGTGSGDVRLRRPE